MLNHTATQRGNMAKHHKHHKQSRKSRQHESEGMKRYYKKYSSKEARAGHRYNESARHRRAESNGMRRHNDEMHERADDESQLYHKGKAYYGQGYGEPSNLPQDVEMRKYPDPYPRLRTEYPDTIEEIDQDALDNYRKVEAYPSDSMY